LSHSPAVRRFDLVSGSQLTELAAAPLPLGMRASDSRFVVHRDLYLDTPDGALRDRGLECRLRIGADDRRRLSLYARTDAGAAVVARPVHAAARAADVAEALREHTAVTRRLRGIVDPALLDVRVALEVERWTRGAHPDWLRRPRLELHYDRVTVRREGAARHFHQLCVHERRDAGDAAERLAQALQQTHGLRPLAADRRERAELLLKWMHHAAPGAGPRARRSDSFAFEHAPENHDLLDPELSILAFQERVLSLAEDPQVPLGERLRFLAIVAANVDEFYTVRVAGLRTAAMENAEENEGRGAAVAQQLAAITERAAALGRRQRECYAACIRALAPHGVRVLRWDDVDDAGRAELRERYEDEIHPSLTPLAMTLSPGHPFPRVPHLSLSLATVLLDDRGGPPHLAQVEIPDELPRFLELPADAARPGVRDLVPLEKVIRAHLHLLHPHARIDQAYFFRITRAGDLQLDEEQATSLLEAVDAATRRRVENAVVRVEVEPDMPAVLRDLVLDELRREPGADALSLTGEDVYEVDAPLDLRGVGAIAPPDDAALYYPPFAPALPVAADASFLAALRARELLVHHPFESFRDSVVRFLAEAAEDPDVTAIKVTLYRVGDRSPIVAALCDAAKRGKQVVAFVELRARFDEERNVAWVRALETAGVHVVYGLVGYKTHAKAALVVRREGGQLRRYAQVGTGNYNPKSGLAYTDLSLFSSDEALTGDVADLFNALTGSSTPPTGLARGVLVAPFQLRQVLLRHIEQEAAHARAGQEGRIRIKVNGLSDAEVVRALTRAAEDGVRVDLIVRGVCTLRPLPPRLRVVTHVGRFLEHSRIYHFANAGAPLHYIGSADLRPRNLRRRVELLAPVRDPDARRTLDRLLDLYLGDPSAWELMPTGAYLPRGGAPSTQELLLRELAAR